MTLFVPKGNLNIPRRNMPQVQRAHFPDLFKWLRSEGVRVRRVKKTGTALKPTQKEINLKAVEQLVKSNDPKLDKPFLITKDGYILDGHHRWLALLNINKKNIIHAFEINLKIKDALKLLRDYPRVLFKDSGNAEYNQPDTNLKLEHDDMPMTEKERLVVELQEKLQGIDTSALDGDEHAMVVHETLDEMLHPPAIEDNVTYASFRDFVNESRKKKFDDPNERIPIKGFGMVRIGELEKMLENRLKDVDKFRKKKDWRNVKHLIENTAVLPMLDALKEIQDANDD